MIHRRVAGLVFGLGLVAAACSSGPSLAQDQATVNQLMAKLSADENSLQTLEGDATMCFGVPGRGNFHCTTPTAQQIAQGRTDAQVVADDKFKLQVAEDQLKKDEG